MASTPPLPPGFKLVSGGQPPARDPWDQLSALGIEATNGYRTPADIQRIAAQGQHPARNSLHLNGDAVDLTPGKSGLTLQQIRQRAQAIANGWKGGRAINEGDHVHLQLPGWGSAPGTPGTPHAGIPPLPPGFKLQQRGSLASTPPAPSFGSAPSPRGALNASTALTPTNLTATGKLHDGDTFRLSNGQNLRLFGADAYELGQKGHRRDGSLVPLGTQARDFMAPRIPGLPVSLTGDSSYGRPVGSLGTPGDFDSDPARQLLRSGNGLAAPEYLRGSPLFVPYMQDERLARLNRLGGHATDAVTPSEFRHGGGPFAQPEVSKDGKGIAIFGDEPTPFQGLRPEIEKGLFAVWNDPSTTFEDALTYAKANGLLLADSAENRKRFKGAKTQPASTVDYLRAPQLLIDPGDGRTGSFLRGFGDPINMIDELGGVADTLGLTPGRENVFNSDRRFGDILWNNIPQNRDILAHDDATHPNFRLGGQLASGLAFPALGVEGVAARATEQALASGASKFAANIAARKAVAQRLAIIGAGQGGLMGFGAGEGGPIARLPGAVVGAAEGAVAAPLLGEAFNLGAHAVGKGFSAARRGVNGLRGRGDGMLTAEPVAPGPLSPVEGVPPMSPDMLQRVNGGAAEGSGFNVMRPSQANGVQPLDPAMIERINGGASVSSDPETFAAMAADSDPTLVGPDMGGPRPRDYLDMGLPPLPPGARLHVPSLSDEQLAAIQSIDPASLAKRPPHSVETLDEAMRASPGRFEELQAPNETDALPKLPMGRSNLFAKPKVRRDIYDVTKMLRKWGGVQDQGGELAHLGITNAPRDNLPFGRNEQFLGRLINDKGMTLDEAGEKLWEAGYFNERPTVSEVLDVLHQEHLGNSHYHPEDLGAVDEFHNLQGQRYAVEQARDEGAPLVDERGQSINFDDLIANTPPLSAYESASPATGKIGNINLNKIENAEDVSQIIKTLDEKLGTSANRRRVGHEETNAAALRHSAREILGKPPGSGWSSSEIRAAMLLYHGALKNVANAARKVAGGSADDALRYEQAKQIAALVHERVTDARGEAGRTLEALKMISREEDAARASALRSLIERKGGRERIEDEAQAFIDVAENPKKAREFVQKHSSPTWLDKFNEVITMARLTDPTTHVRNMGGNTLAGTLMFPEKAVEAGLSHLARPFGGRVEDRSYFSEVPARAGAMVKAVPDAIKNMARAFHTGEPIDSASKVEARHYHAIGGRKGDIIRLPGRLLTAADEAQKTLISAGEIAALARRKAINAGDKSLERQLRLNPSDDMRKAADAEARYRTYQQELGVWGKDIQRWANTLPGLKIILTFVRTPINLVKFAGERSPAALVMPSVVRKLIAGGQPRYEALSRAIVGNTVGVGAVALALQGRISGNGPSDPRARAELMRSGWRPQSFRVGDKWLSYAGLDPIATLIATSADLAESGRWATEDERAHIVSNIVLSAAKNFTDNAWFRGLSDFFGAVSDEHKASSFVARTLSGLTPAGLNHAAQIQDPTIRDTRINSQGESDPFLKAARMTLDAVKARVPVLSESLPVRRDIWGEPLRRDTAYGPDIASPLRQSTISNDPLDKEVGRLLPRLSMPDHSLTIDGEKVALSPKQYDDYVQLSGKPARAYLETYVLSPEWLSMSDAERIDALKETMSEFRESARDELLDRYPELEGSAPQAPAGLPPLPPGFKLHSPPSGPPRASVRPTTLGSVVNKGVNPGAVPPLPPGFKLVNGGK